MKEEKVGPFVLGRLENMFNNCVKLDAELIEKRNKVLQIQQKVAQSKAQGGTVEDSKEDLVEAVVANTEAAIIERNLYNYMAVVSELKFISDSLGLDLSGTINEEGLKIVDNIVNATKPVYSADSGKVEPTDKEFIDQIISEARVKASEESKLNANFNSITIEDK